MADSTQVRTQLSVFLQRKVASDVKNTLFNIMPTLEFFCALNGDKEGASGLGRPQAGMFAVGRINGVSRPRKATVQAHREYLPIVQTTKPSKTERKAMTDYDSDPVVPSWDTTNAPMKRFKQPRFKFARFKMPYKIPHSELRTVMNSGLEGGQAAKAVGSVYEVEVKSRMAALCESLNDDMFKQATSAGAPTDEDAVQWDRFHSIPYAIGANTLTYAGIDRSVAANAFWKGALVSSTFTGSFEDMINNANYDQGMIDKGLGVQLIAVGKTLMKRAKAEAKAEGYQLMTNGIPEFPEFGFKREIVRIFSGNRAVYVYYDPQVNQLDTDTSKSNALCLDPSTWTVIIHPDANFKVSKPADQTEVEGGDEADTGTIHLEMLLACEVPSGNAYFSDVQ
jgi:hypothetical protein